MRIKMGKKNHMGTRSHGEIWEHMNMNINMGTYGEIWGPDHMGK